MKKKYIVIVAAIILVIAFGLVAFKIISNKRMDTVINDYSSDSVLLTIGTMEPDNSKSFIFTKDKDNIVLVKGYTGITGKFTITDSQTISDNKYNTILKQVESATKCDNAYSDCYSVTFKGKETFFVKQSDVNLKY